MTGKAQVLVLNNVARHLVCISTVYKPLELMVYIGAHKLIMNIAGVWRNDDGCKMTKEEVDE